MTVSAAADVSDVAAITAGAAALAAVAGVAAYGMFVPASRFFGPVISRAGGSRAGAGAVALTFDDGPWPGGTERILEILAREGVRAAFFVIGRYAAEHPEMVRRIHDEGHLIGNHTFDHSRLGMFRGWTYWDDQVRRTNEVVAELTGSEPVYFRPPMGFKSPPSMRAARRNGCEVVTWSRRALDGVTTTADAIVRHVSGAEDGEIVLMHDGRDPMSRREVGATAEALPEVIARLRDKGLGIVRLDELLGTPGDQAIPPG